MRKLTSALGLALALTWASTAAAQDVKSSIVGLWKLTSHGNKIVATGALEYPYGEHPNGYQLFTRSGQMMFSMYNPARKPPAGVPTAAEKVALFDSALAQIGGYSVMGNKVAIRYLGTMNQTEVGTDRTYIGELSGKKLTLTAEPFKSATTGQQIISIRTFERVD